MTKTSHMVGSYDIFERIQHVENRTNVVSSQLRTRGGALAGRPVSQEPRQSPANQQQTHEQQKSGTKERPWSHGAGTSDRMIDGDGDNAALVGREGCSRNHPAVSLDGVGTVEIAGAKQAQLAVRGAKDQLAAVGADAEASVMAGRKHCHRQTHSDLVIGANLTFADEAFARRALLASIARDVRALGRGSIRFRSVEPPRGLGTGPSDAIRQPEAWAGRPG